jgi:NADPH:quinone reductase-like Zn-dependent oxidoreductase
MRAFRVHQSGGIDTMRLDEIPCPVPEEGEVLVAVKAAEVGPWDRLVREGLSGLGQALPLTLGSDISGNIFPDAADPDRALGGAPDGLRLIGVGVAEWAAVPRWQAWAPKTIAR